MSRATNLKPEAPVAPPARPRAFAAFSAGAVGSTTRSTCAPPAAPFAPTSTVELDTSLDYNFRPDGLGFFVSGGLALAIFIPPDEAEAFTGAGPTVGLGYRLERVEFGWDSTVLPEVLHDGKDRRTGVITNVSIRCRF